MSPRPVPLATRLPGRYTVDETTGCWLWLGDKRNGYGSVWVNGKRTYAHRAVFELYKRPLLAGEHVCHRCDTPACINPDHLFAGTRTINAKDMWSKGRGSPPPHWVGEAHPRAKLSDADVAAIRLAKAAGTPTVELMQRYNVTKTTINTIARGDSRGGGMSQTERRRLRAARRVA